MITLHSKLSTLHSKLLYTLHSKLALRASTIALLALLTACQRPFTSPSGNIELNASVNEQGTPVYEVYKNGQAVILPSELGLTFVTTQGDTVDNTGWQLTSTSRDSHNETWETVWGEEQFINNHYRELTLHLTKPLHSTLSTTLHSTLSTTLNSTLSTLHLNIVFRLFDDGFAFRYVFPDNDTITVLDEHSSYTFAQEPEVWSIPWRTEYYEALWTKQPLSQLDTVCSPITLELADGTYAFVHEAALTDYPCQNLYLNKSLNSTLSTLNYSPLSTLNYSTLYTLNSTLSTHLTPWRKGRQVLRDKAYL
ncbi:MAG: glycoside hydrolase family 97 N-terminal domain-containing protein, partial [Paludibacteraceae bacterium]|nr:glycoside hydrolase family 97 N-terminal domain-containing protein [Paludibacteraceae bacterium]